MLAADRAPTHLLLAAKRVAVPLLLVGAVTAAGLAVEVATTPAALALLTAVVASALLGRGAGLVGAVSSIVALHIWFTPGVGLWEFTDRDELMALITYLAVALVVGSLVARSGDLRRRAELGEREARIRLDLKRRLLAGEPPDEVVRSAAAALVGLFGLASCRVGIDGIDERVDGEGGPGRTDVIEIGTARVEAAVLAGRPGLTDADRAVIEALAAGLAAAVELVRVAAEAKRVRQSAETSRMRARVLSAVSHNLRTPLSAIRASAELLEGHEGTLDGAARAQLLATVREEALRLERFVANTLDLGRLRAGGLVPERRPVEVGDLVQAAVKRIEPLAATHQIRVAVEPGVPELHVDVGMMEQVLGNLLENALRYAPEGGDITVRAQAADAAVEVRVVDRGPGIPPGQRRRVFEEFARGPDQHDEAQGAGLGLAIVRSMVDAHGGATWYEETPGGGATFALRLPLELPV